MEMSQRVVDGRVRGPPEVSGQGKCVGQPCAMKDCPSPNATSVPQVEKQVGFDR